MLRNSTRAPVALALSLLFPACDDMTQSDTDADPEVEVDEDAGEDEDAGFGFGEVKPRCTPPPCIDPPVSNTNWVGPNPIDTVTHSSWNTPTQLSNGKYMRLTGAWCPGGSNPFKFDATSKGELVFHRYNVLGIPTTVQGAAVQGCQFHAQFSDTVSFATHTDKDITITRAVPVTRANMSTGFKYLMTVFSDDPDEDDVSIPTCHDSADAPGNYYLQVRPGLVLDRSTWTLTADPTKQSWVCTAGAAGHFALKNVDVEDISAPSLATAEMRAWGLYHHGSSHTSVGNPVKIRYNGPGVIMGYDSAPDVCNDAADWYTEARFASGSLLCRGMTGTAWSDEINRNAWSYNRDWDDDSSVADVPVCSGTETYEFETYARCYMNGSTRVCPSTSGC